MADPSGNTAGGTRRASGPGQRTTPLARTDLAPRASDSHQRRLSQSGGHRSRSRWSFAPGVPQRPTNRVSQEVHRQNEGQTLSRGGACRTRTYSRPAGIARRRLLASRVPGPAGDNSPGESQETWWARSPRSPGEGSPTGLEPDSNATQCRTAVKPKLTNRALRRGERRPGCPSNRSRHQGDFNLRG
jgi:hypothetical protein